MTRLERYRLGYLLHGSILTPTFYRNQEASMTKQPPGTPDPLDELLDEIEQEKKPEPKKKPTPTVLPSRRRTVRLRTMRRSRP